LSSARITRRRFVVGSAGAAGALWLPATSAAARRRRHLSAHVVVVGAGMAGLTAARQLAAAGRDVVVLEAQRRVGGRVQNHRVAPGVITELGGEFVGPTQDHVLALAARLGIGTFKTYNEGNNVLFLNGRRSLYPASPGVSPDPDFQAAVAAGLKLDAMAAEVPVDRPWRARHAAAWDRQTFGHWVDAHLPTRGARTLVKVASRAIWGADPEDMSLLYALFYTAAAGNPQTKGSFLRLIATGGGAQDSRILGGSQRIPLELARRLGRRVVLGAPVRRIVRERGGVRVEAAGIEVRAQRAIVAAPPLVAASIDYSPRLPRAKLAAMRAARPGNLSKWEAVYDRPFWRDAGLSGQVISELDPANSTFDNSPPSGSPGIVFGFVGGAARRANRGGTLARHRAKLVSNLVALFGDEARDVRAYYEGNWNDRDDVWTRGCPVAHFGRGRFLPLAPHLRARVGPIHFAGTETATYWNGYMDGAVSSGERAAREVVR
jgi:monoamine oxidase